MRNLLTLVLVLFISFSAFSQVTIREAKLLYLNESNLSSLDSLIGLKTASIRKFATDKETGIPTGLITFYSFSPMLIVIYDKDGVKDFEIETEPEKDFQILVQKGDFVIAKTLLQVNTK